MCAKGRNGQVEVLPDRVRITRHGVLAFLSHGAIGARDVPFGHVDSTALRLPTSSQGGAFSVIVKGRGRPTHLLKDPFTVLFSAPQQHSFEFVKNVIDEKLRSNG